MKRRSEEPRATRRPRRKTVHLDASERTRQRSLRELRRMHPMTQQQLADALSIGQDSVSRLEQRADLRVSTLRGYVEALGGQLILVAQFPGQPAMAISGFERTR